MDMKVELNFLKDTRLDAFYVQFCSLQAYALGY